MVGDPADTACLPGTRVLEFSNEWSAGALCGRLLADLGATVTKATVDGGLTDDVIDELVNGHDIVLVDDWWARRLPGHIDRWRDRRPDLVGCTVSYFGQHNEFSGLPSNELVAQSMWGLTRLTGHPDAKPTRVGVPLSAAAAALVACGAVLAAAYRRDRTGFGGWIDCAESDVVAMMHGNFLPGLFTEGKVPERMGNSQPVSAPWNSYPTLDGEVVIVAISDGLWQRLADAMGRPDLGAMKTLHDVAGRVASRALLDDAIGAWTSSRTTADVVGSLAAARIPAGEIKPLDAALRASDFVVDLIGAVHTQTLIAISSSGPDQVGKPPAVDPSSGLRPPLDGVRVLEDRKSVV